MRNSTLSKGARNGIALAALMCAANLQTSAATFTAVASGNFSSSTTWTGGLVPAVLTTADVIVIPSGITVNLDQNVTLNGATSALVVNGAITSTTNNALILTSTTFSGSGSIAVDSLAMSLMSGFAYAGSITVQKMSTAGANIASAATVTVNNALRLTSGTMTLAAGTLVMGTNATIYRTNGALNTTGGTVNLTNAYNVVFDNQSNINGGLELNGAGLTNVGLNSMSNAGVALSNDLVVRGTMTLNSGTLRLNGRNLSFASASDFSTAGTGSIASSSTSNLSLTSTSAFTGGIRFRVDSNTINNVTVNSSTGATARLGSTLNVAGTLSLQNGRLDIGNNQLNLMGSSSTAISGGSATSYVVTGNGGQLGLNIGSNASGTFYVGSNNYFAPMTIAANSGNGSGMLSVGVTDSVRFSGNTGAAMSATRKMVNATWNVTSANTSNVNVNMTAMWSANMEVNGFNRNQAMISHYTSGSWDATATNAASTSGSLYALSRNNITSFSPFAVMEKDALSVLSASSSASAVTLYPNPAATVLHINGVENVQSVSVYSLAGNLVANLQYSQSGVSVASLAPGSYFVAVRASGGEVIVKKFTKL